VLTIWQNNEAMSASGTKRTCSCFRVKSGHRSDNAERPLLTQSGHLAGRYVARVDSSHRRCDPVPANIDRWRHDRSIRHFLPGDNEDLCARLEVIQVARNEPHDGGVGRHNDFLLAIGILHHHDLAIDAFGGEVIRHGPLTALIRLLRNLVTLFHYVFEISGHLAPSFQNVPQGTEKCFAQSNMAFEELHVIVHRCLRHHRGGEPCAQLRSWELLPWY